MGMNAYDATKRILASLVHQVVQDLVTTLSRSITMVGFIYSFYSFHFIQTVDLLDIHFTRTSNYVSCSTSL